MFYFCVNIKGLKKLLIYNKGKTISVEIEFGLVRSLKSLQKL